MLLEGTMDLIIIIIIIIIIIKNAAQNDIIKKWICQLPLFIKTIYII